MDRPSPHPSVTPKVGRSYLWGRQAPTSTLGRVRSAAALTGVIEVRQEALEPIRDRFLYHLFEHLTKLAADMGLELLAGVGRRPPVEALGAPFRAIVHHHPLFPRLERLKPLVRPSHRPSGYQEVRNPPEPARATTDSVALSGPKSLDAETPSISVSLARARLTRLLIVPTAQFEIFAASS